MQEIAEFDTIKKLSDIIAKTVKPLQIYLFGSFATGHQNAESDYDFFIIVDNNVNTDDIRFIAGKALWGKRNRPIDILVSTKKRFEYYKQDSFRVEYDVVREGVLLYERKKKGYKNVQSRIRI